MKLTAVGLCFLLFSTFAWAPTQPPGAAIRQLADTEYALGYVLRKADQYNVPRDLALSIWQKEASFRTEVPDGKAGERGAFQITRDAATDSRCNWSRLRKFRYSADCGMRYLKSSLRLCKYKTRAANRYNTGTCSTKSGKLGLYGQRVALLMMRYARS